MSPFVLILIVLASGLASCAGVQTARFQGPGPYSSPYSSETAINYQPGEFNLAWPVRHVRINQHYAPPRNRRHQGIDLGGGRGTPILAAHEGIVVYTGNKFSGYGKMVLIEFDSRWATLYAHLDDIDVREGQRIYQGDQIGKMGRTGRATGVHLHFEVMRNKVPVDPLRYLMPIDNIVSK